MFPVIDASTKNIKYASLSRAVVINNVDPAKKGRIEVNSPVVGKTGWIPYLQSPFGYDVPEIGDVVYIMADGGYETHPIAIGRFNKLKEDGTINVPEEFIRHKPTNRGFFTPGGHLVELDDGKNIAGLEKGIRIKTVDGKQFSMIDDPTAKAITIVDENGNKVNIDSLTNVMDIQIQSTTAQIDGLNDKITMSAAFGDTISISAADGIQTSTPAPPGTSMSMKSGTVEIKGAATTLGSTLKLNNDGKMALGNSGAELLDLFDKMLEQLDMLTTALGIETHTGNLGYPTSPPLNASTYTQVKTQLGLLKTQLGLIKGSL